MSSANQIFEPMTVDNRGGIKISDFGISKKVEESKLVRYFEMRSLT